MSERAEISKLIRRLMWFAGGALSFFAITVGAFYWLQHQAVRDLGHTREVARIGRTTAGLAIDRETGIRGYVITHDAISLAPDVLARKQLPIMLDSLRSLTRGDSAQAHHVRAIAAALATWEKEFAAPAIAGAITNEQRALAGKPLFDAIRVRFDQLLQPADADFREKSARLLKTNLAGALVLLTELAIFFGAFLFLVYGRLVVQAADLTRQQTLLEQQAIELELQMHETEEVNNSLSGALAETKRKDEQLKGSLKQREEAAAFLESALSSSPVGFAFWDRELRFIKANRQLASTRSMAPEDFVGKTMQEVAPDVARKVQPLLEEVLASRKGVPNVELTRNGTDHVGPPIYNRASFYPVTTPEGDFLAVGAVITDVTEAHLRDEKLRRSEERYRYAAHLSNDAIYDWDVASNRFEWNDGLQQLFGYAKEEIGTTIEWIVSLLHPEDTERVMGSFYAVFEKGGGSQWKTEYRLRRKDGKYASAEGRAYIIREADGTPKRVIGAISDLTLQQSLESQLRQSQKMEAIGRLAGGIAHDFNNILTVIRMSSEFLLEDLPKTNESRQEAQEILKAADRAAALTRQLLAFSRHQVVTPRPVALNQIVEGLNGMLRRVVPENIEINTELGPQLSTIKADTGQLEQVLLNLVINAADAMPNGGRIDIRTSNVEVDATFSASHLDLGPGSYVSLTVSDTGHGMDGETAMRIFDPFFTTKPVGKGTGLGLATVHGIVTQTGGKIWVYSEPGHGTTFKIFLRKSEGAARAITPRSVKRLSPPTETILLVEDEASTCHAVERSLTRAGYKVLIAVNGLEALEIAEANAGGIDCVLTDTMMPEMGGLELVSRLRKTRPDLRVLMMSGYTEQTTAERFGLSSLPFIEKPFPAADLLDAIHVVLHGEQDVLEPL